MKNSKKKIKVLKKIDVVKCLVLIALSVCLKKT